MSILNRVLGKSYIPQLENSEVENNSGLWEVIVKYNGDIQFVAAEVGAEAEILSERYAILTIEYEKIPLLLNYTEIEYIEPPKILTLNLKEELSQSCIKNVQNGDIYGLSGSGVVVAVLDSGIDYTHADFINDDGTSRILYMWDQTVDGNPPEGFLHGAEYTNDQINMALTSSDPYQIVPETDNVGHGTAIAGVIAGNGRNSDGENIGVAPDCNLIIVKLGERGYPGFAKTTELMRALKYSVDKAEILGMPLIINISYGTNDGPHNGQSLFETFIDNIAQRWKTCIVVAVGNEGNAKHHYSGKISTNETQEITFFYAGKYPSFYITLWKDFVDDFTVELILPSGQSTGQVVSYEINRDYRIGDISIFISYGQPWFYSIFQEVFFQISSGRQLLPPGVYTIRIKSSKIVDGKFDIYLPTVEEVTRETAFAFADVNSTITLPATAKNVISVAGYDSARNIISDFSGLGYTLDIVYAKPDIAAPSVGVVSTAVGGGYSAFSGTSIAAPFVSGAVALMMQWGIVNGNDPFLYGERVKAYLKSGAQRLPNVNYPNNSWGYGTLCLQNTMNQLQTFNGYILK